MKRLTIIILFTLLFLASCQMFSVKNVTPVDVPTQISTETPLQIPPDAATQIQDISQYSQDPLYYAQKYTPDSPLLTSEAITKHQNDFNRKFYRVWITAITPRSPIAQYTMQNYTADIQKYIKHPGYGENKLHRDSLYIYGLDKTANLKNGFNTMKSGIMTQYSHIRTLPTYQPYFLDFSKAGEGYPFDYWQMSTIPIATPVFIYHTSEGWALIDSHICSGWVPLEHIAYLDDAIIQEIIAAPKIAITTDKTSLYNEHRSYIGRADIGTVLSITEENTISYQAILIIKNERGYGEKTIVNIAKTNAKMIPIPLTQRNIATLCQMMMNQTYGWGGLYFNRDCSQTLLDLFIGFGILLPRNGKQQANNFGTFENLAKSMNKKTDIIEKAVPFLTLVRTPGHIMLYVGHENGEPLVFHNIWGLRIVDENGKDGRYIIGKAVITTLEPGKEIQGINPNSTLVHRLEGITFF